jgi:hypothetical protein
MLEFDLRFLRSVHLPPSPALRQALLDTKRTMTLALAVLWLSGGALVALAWQHNPDAMLNEKLWVKVITVCCLTLNGALMHRYAFPKLAGQQAFLALPTAQVLGLTLFAVVSSVSWLYASFLGIARSWNHSTSFEHALGVYLGLLTLAVVGALGLVSLLRWRWWANVNGVRPLRDAWPTRCPHSS